MDLKHTSIDRLFLRYLWPALAAVLIKSVLVSLDSIFVGQQVGATGLAAMRLVMPLQSVFGAIAMMIAMGGAALMSIAFGQGRVQEGRAIFSQSINLLLMSSLLLAILGSLYVTPLVQWLGAEGELAQVASDYLRIILVFFVFSSLMHGVMFFVVNDQNPRLPMYALGIGAVFNTLVSYWLVMVLKLGVEGAAISSVLTQLVMLAVFATHFIGKRGQLRWPQPWQEFSHIKSIVSTGSPAFVLEAASAVTALAYNQVLLTRYGELHLAAYGITMSIGMLLLFVLGAIGQASQPIISFNHGAGLGARTQQMLIKGLRWSLMIGLAATFIMGVVAKPLVNLFIPDNQLLMNLAVEAVQLLFLSAPMLGLNLMATTYFQAIKLPRYASLIGLCHGFVFVIVGLVVLPHWWVDTGVWWVPVLAQVLTLPISAWLMRRFYLTHKPAYTPA